MESMIYTGSRKALYCFQPTPKITSSGIALHTDGTLFIFAFKFHKISFNVDFPPYFKALNKL